MKTEVNTGGLKKFVYSKNHRPKRDVEFEGNIASGHRKYYKRKQKEAKRLATIYSILALILFVYGLVKSETPFFVGATLLAGCSSYWIWKCGNKR